MMAYLTHDPIDVGLWHQQAASERDGASVEFLGIVRGEEDGRPITHLDYEAYEPMAERLIAQLVDEAKVRWPIHQIYVRHRVGRVPVGQIAVLIGIRCPHRDQAFEACRFLIDAMKQDVPIWKRAVGIDGTVTEVTCAHGNTAH
jgi:molybdopterin synthase catalytic subunit